MLNYKTGRPIGLISSGKKKGEIIYIDAENKDGVDQIDLGKGNVVPIMNPEAREVDYIAGPSGSGKSSYAAMLAKSYHKLYPKNDMYIFSRDDATKDPAFKKLKLKQVMLDDSIVDDPIDIDEVAGGSLIIFDDTGTIIDKRIKEAVDKLIMDIMETGRKKDISLILTSHLVNPNERKFSRTVLNEMQALTCFPSSGSSYQIKYVLKMYFGLDNKKIDEILKLNSRWVTIYKNYPMTVMYEHGAFTL